MLTDRPEPFSNMPHADDYEKMGWVILKANIEGLNLSRRGYEHTLFLTLSVSCMDKSVLWHDGSGVVWQLLAVINRNRDLAKALRTIMMLTDHEIYLPQDKINWPIRVLVRPGRFAYDRKVAAIGNSTLDAWIWVSQ